MINNAFPVVILTTFDLDEYALAAVRAAGACGFLLKDGNADDLIAGIRNTAAYAERLGSV